MSSEEEARKGIDALLEKAGWKIADADKVNLSAQHNVAIREFPLKQGHGFADYLLYVEGKAAGVIEAKKAGVTLTGVETQSDKYIRGLPDGLPAWVRPLPFSYQSTGTETRFTNGFDPQPRARNVFAFHRPEALAAWLDGAVNTAAEGPIVRFASQAFSRGAALRVRAAKHHATAFVATRTQTKTTDRP